MSNDGHRRLADAVNEASETFQQAGERITKIVQGVQDTDTTATFVTPPVGVANIAEESTPYVDVCVVKLGHDEIGPRFTSYEQAKTFAAGVLAGLEAGFHMGVAEEQAGAKLRELQKGNQ